MRKNIIALSLAKVNARMERAEERLNAASGIHAVKLANEAHTEAYYIQSTLNDIVQAVPVSVSSFQWELDGGDGFNTSKLVTSGLWTAYASVTQKWFDDNEIFKDRGMTPVEWMELLESQKATGLDHMQASSDGGENVDLTLEERLSFAQAWFVYCLHIAHFKGGEYKWLLSMDIEEHGEIRTQRRIVTLRDWLEERRQGTSSKRMDAAYKLMLEDKICDEFEENLPHIDHAMASARVWLHMPCDDGTYSSRHQRIVSRVADRKYEDLMSAIYGGDLNEVAKAAKPWELILASPRFQQDHASFITSREYKLFVLDKKVCLVEAEEAKKQEEARLNSIENALNQRLIALGLMEAPAPVAEPTPEVPAAPASVVPLTGIHGTPRMPNYAGRRA